jgi:hypothetical protein
VHACSYCLADPKRAGGPVSLAHCWSHCRREFFDLAKTAPAPIATEALKRMAEFYEIETEIRGRSADERRAVRQEKTKPLVEALKTWREKILVQVPADRKSPRPFATPSINGKGSPASLTTAASRSTPTPSSALCVRLQQFMHVSSANDATAYMPISGFTAVDLRYQKGDAVSNFVTRFDEPGHAQMYLQLFDQIWSDLEKVQDVTAAICDHIESVYQENSPERIYFMMLYNVFLDFLEHVDEDVLPNDLTGYRESMIWHKLYNFQKDAATGIINKLETYNGCILADSVGLGKTFTALAVIKYYELRNRSVLVFCPKKIADNWQNYNTNLTTNIFAKDRFNYDVLCHTDLSRSSGESFGIPLSRVNWGNYDLIIIDESHNFRNNDVYKDRETRYQKLMNKVIRAGVKTKVLMLSATPVNNRFNDLRNQLALAYEGQSEALSKNLKTQTSIEEIFRRAQKAFNEWSLLPPEERTAASILKTLDFDFFELLDAVTIARSRKHIETFYDTKDIGKFPQRRKPLSFHRPITERSDVMGFNDIFTQLSVLKLAVYAPISYILPSRLRKYEEIYDTQVEGGRGKLRQADRERSLQALMTTNLLKRLESSVAAFRLTLRSLGANISRTLDAITEFEKTGRSESVSDHLAEMSDFDPEDDDLSGLDEFTVGKKSRSALPTWTCHPGSTTWRPTSSSSKT